MSAATFKLFTVSASVRGVAESIVATGVGSGEGAPSGGGRRMPPLRPRQAALSGTAEMSAPILRRARVKEREVSGTTHV